MKTTTATIRIRLDQAVEVEQRGMNLSEFVREKLDEAFGSTDFIAEKEKELKEQLKKLKNIKKEAKIEQKTSEKEEQFFKETREILKKDPSFMQGRWNFYKNTFHKSISLDKFRELIDGSA